MDQLRLQSSSGHYIWHCLHCLLQYKNKSWYYYIFNTDINTILSFRHYYSAGTIWKFKYILNLQFSTVDKWFLNATYDTDIEWRSMTITTIFDQQKEKMSIFLESGTVSFEIWKHEFLIAIQRLNLQ